MVNVRATLRAALEASVVSTALYNEFLMVAKGLFYPDRSYRRVLREIAAHWPRTEELQHLTSYLEHGRIDQKRVDALEMLRVMQITCEEGVPPPSCSFHFFHTDAWQAFVAAAGDSAPQETLGSRL